MLAADFGTVVPQTRITYSSDVDKVFITKVCALGVGKLECFHKSMQCAHSVCRSVKVRGCQVVAYGGIKSNC